MRTKAILLATIIAASLQTFELRAEDDCEATFDRATTVMKDRFAGATWKEQHDKYTPADDNDVVNIEMRDIVMDAYRPDMLTGRKVRISREDASRIRTVIRDFANVRFLECHGDMNARLRPR